MMVKPCDIGHSGELHKLYVEYCGDAGKRVPTADFWLVNFTKPNFFCLLAKHGRKPVGFVMGEIEPYYENPSAKVDVVFIRRGFKGKLKFIRALVREAKSFIKSEGASSVSFNRIKSRERAI
jgi:hypothetical protein